MAPFKPTPHGTCAASCSQRPSATAWPCTSALLTRAAVLAARSWRLSQRRLFGSSLQRAAAPETPVLGACRVCAGRPGHGARTTWLASVAPSSCPSRASSWLVPRKPTPQRGERWAGLRALGFEWWPERPGGPPPSREACGTWERSAVCGRVVFRVTALPHPRFCFSCALFVTTEPRVTGLPC